MRGFDFKDFFLLFLFLSSFHLEPKPPTLICRGYKVSEKNLFVFVFIFHTQAFFLSYISPRTNHFFPFLLLGLQILCFVVASLPASESNHSWVNPWPKVFRSNCSSYSRFRGRAVLSFFFPLLFLFLLHSLVFPPPPLLSPFLRHCVWLTHEKRGKRRRRKKKRTHARPRSLVSASWLRPLCSISALLPDLVGWVHGPREQEG